MNTESQSTNNTEKPDEQQRKPDEQVGFYFSSALKIFDKDTGEIFVQIRGD